MVVLEFRRAVAPNPIHSADEVAARLFQSSRAFTDSAPSDSPQKMQAHAFDLPRFLKATETLSETLIRQRNNAIFWSGFLNGLAIGVLIVAIIAILGWPR